MLERLWRFFRVPAQSYSPPTEYDPVYGLPKRAVEEWLARNPRLREKHEVEEWLVVNPPLQKEHEASLRQRSVA
jgi:hypothetical protein